MKLSYLWKPSYGHSTIISCTIRPRLVQIAYIRSINAKLLQRNVYIFHDTKDSCHFLFAFRITNTEFFNHANGTVPPLNYHFHYFKPPVSQVDSFWVSLLRLWIRFQAAIKAKVHFVSIDWLFLVRLMSCREWCPFWCAFSFCLSNRNKTCTKTCTIRYIWHQAKGCKILFHFTDIESFNTTVF